MSGDSPIRAGASGTGDVPGSAVAPTPAGALETLARAFLDRTLAKKEWTHEAHLRVGLWHVARFGEDEALGRLRSGIRSLNEAHGVANTDSGGYHETITRFYVHRIARFLESLEAAADLDAAADALAVLLADRELPLRHWSRDLLFSPRARAGWVEPDLHRLHDDGKATFLPTAGAAAGRGSGSRHWRSSMEAHLRVARPVRDLARSAAMYEAALGLSRLGHFEDHEGFDGVMLGTPGGAFHFEFTSCRHHPVEPAPTPEDLVVFYLPDRVEWSTRCAAMLEAGFREVPSFNPYWNVDGRTFEDPDGYRTVLQCAEWSSDASSGG